MPIMMDHKASRLIAFHVSFVADAVVDAQLASIHNAFVWTTTNLSNIASCTMESLSRKVLLNDLRLCVSVLIFVLKC